MELMFNGMGILKVEDNNYYIVDEEFEVYKKVTREDFIKDMNKYAYVCLTSWDKQDRQNYLDLVDYVERIGNMKLDIQQFGGRGASSSNGSTSSWNSLTRMFKNNLQTEGINNIQLNGRDEIQKIWDIQNSEYRDYNNITLDELNNSPIAIYFNGDYGQYMNVYKNRKEMFNSIKKEYGGFKEYTAGNLYSISYVGKGEFYLTRDRFSTGGWKWTDGNGRTVEYEKQRKKYKY